MNNFIDNTEFIFNTNVYQKICTNGVDGSLILDKAIKIMKEFENKLSFYKENSDVDKINKNAGKEFVQVSKDTFEIIKKSKFYSQITNGLFDITIGPLVKEWGINTLNPKVVDDNKKEELLALVNYKDILLDETNLSIMLANKNQQIDLGGIAKGYIADKIIELYKKNNVTCAIINIGGNIKILGKKDKDSLWNVGVFEPKKHSKNIILSMSLENLSIVTSGAYERAFMYNNKLYHHILNTYNGEPAKTDFKSITIISKESIEGDALSTPLFIMGKYKACDFIKKNNLSAIMITEDDEIIITKDLIEKVNLFSDYKVLAF